VPLGGGGGGGGGARRPIYLHEPIYCVDPGQELPSRGYKGKKESKGGPRCRVSGEGGSGMPQIDRQHLVSPTAKGDEF